jgi:hypothetical protein
MVRKRFEDRKLETPLYYCTGEVNVDYRKINR